MTELPTTSGAQMAVAPPKLLTQQREIFEVLQTNANLAGFCLVLGEPGPGKSHVKRALQQHDPKTLIVPVVNRTLHTYYNTLRILCGAFDGGSLLAQSRESRGPQGRGGTAAAIQRCNSRTTCQ